MTLTVHPEATYFIFNGYHYRIMSVLNTCSILAQASIRFPARVSDDLNTSGPIAVFSMEYDMSVK